MIILRDDPNKNVCEVFNHSTIAHGECLSKTHCKSNHENVNPGILKVT